MQSLPWALKYCFFAGGGGQIVKRHGFAFSTCGDFQTSYNGDGAAGSASGDFLCPFPKWHTCSLFTIHVSEILWPHLTLRAVLGGCLAVQSFLCQRKKISTDKLVSAVVVLQVLRRAKTKLLELSPIRAMQSYEKNSNYRQVFKAMLQFGRAYSSLSQQPLFCLEIPFSSTKGAWDLKMPCILLCSCCLLNFLN